MVELTEKEICDEVFEFCNNRDDNQSRISMVEILNGTSCKTLKQASTIYGYWLVDKYYKNKDKKSDEEE